MILYHYRDILPTHIAYVSSPTIAALLTIGFNILDMVHLIGVYHCMVGEVFAVHIIMWHNDLHYKLKTGFN